MRMSNGERSIAEEKRSTVRKSGSGRRGRPDFFFKKKNISGVCFATSTSQIRINSALGSS